MVSKETCPRCRGEKYVLITLADGRNEPRKCPSCAGNGFKVRVVR